VPKVSGGLQVGDMLNGDYADMCAGKSLLLSGYLIPFLNSFGGLDF
jgi:hypothetical protein